VEKSNKPGNSQRSHSTTTTTNRKQPPVIDVRLPCAVLQQRQQQKRKKKALGCPQTVVMTEIRRKGVVVQRLQRHQPDEQAGGAGGREQTDQQPRRFAEGPTFGSAKRPPQADRDRREHDQIQLIQENPSAPGSKVQHRHQSRNGDQPEAGTTPQQQDINRQTQAESVRAQWVIEHGPADQGAEHQGEQTGTPAGGSRHLRRRGHGHIRCGGDAGNPAGNHAGQNEGG
jgi:hypothetical protein